MKKPDPLKDLGICECGCSFFEVVEANQVVYQHMVALGQAPPVIGVAHLLRCLKCRAFIYPQIQNVGNMNSYEELVKEIENS